MNVRRAFFVPLLLLCAGIALAQAPGDETKPMLKMDKIVTDSELPVTGTIIESDWHGRTALFKLTLKPEKGAQVAETSAASSAKPIAFSLTPKGAPPGDYRVFPEFFTSDGAVNIKILGLDAPIRLVPGLTTKAADFEKRLAKIDGHDSTKATIRYPFDLARVINQGKRVLEPEQFGNNPSHVGKDSPPYDFVKGIQRSQQLLEDLEKGTDPLWQAQGDVRRNYYFKEADEILPYRLYCPTTWDGKSKLPLLVVLHGNTRDQDFYFDRDGGLLPKTAEKYGWLVVCPCGYHPNGGWGAGGKGAPVAANSRGALSEKDGINVVDLVMKEYPVDPKQVYLFGHSSGGTGTWHMAQKYPERWAAIGISAGGANAATYPFEKIKGKPVLIFFGTDDKEANINVSRAMNKALADRSMEHRYYEIPGKDHVTIVAEAIPRVFENFDKHLKTGAITHEEAK